MAAPSENSILAHESRKHTALSACGAAAITLDAPIGKTTRAVHCNTAGTGLCYFPDGSTADIVFLAGLTYDLAVTQIDDTTGTPTLIALF